MMILVTLKPKDPNSILYSVHRYFPLESESHLWREVG